MFTLFYGLFDSYSEIHYKTLFNLWPVNDLADIPQVFIILTSLESSIYLSKSNFCQKIEIGKCHATYYIHYNIEAYIFHLRPKNQKSDCGDRRKSTLCIFKSLIKTR